MAHDLSRGVWESSREISFQFTEATPSTAHQSQSLAFAILGPFNVTFSSHELATELYVKTTFSLPGPRSNLRTILSVFWMPFVIPIKH